jgi:hypothetical protein
MTEHPGYKLAFVGHSLGKANARHSYRSHLSEPLTSKKAALLRFSTLWRPFYALGVKSRSSRLVCHVCVLSWMCVKQRPGLKLTGEQVANGDFAAWVNNYIRDVSRVYSDHDLVPKTPMGMGYQHLGSFIHVLARPKEHAIVVDWHRCNGASVHPLRLRYVSMRPF